MAVRSLLAGLLLLGVGACDLSGAVPSHWVLAKASQSRLEAQVAQLDAAMPAQEDGKRLKKAIKDAQAEVLAGLDGLFGPPDAPHWPMGRTGSEAPPLLAEAAALYLAECAHCHGLEGFGNGVSSHNLNPAPWNFSIGVFPRSAPSGGLPKPQALKDLLSNGIDAVSMPPFERLGEDALIGLTGHVLLLTRRAQVERILVEAWIEGGPGSLSAERTLEIYLAWEAGESNPSQKPYSNTK